MGTIKAFFREIAEIGRSTLLALVISFVFLWCRSFDRYANKLSLAFSELTVVLLFSLVALLGIVFAVICRVSPHTAERREGLGCAGPSFSGMMKTMNVYLLIWFLILFSLWLYETFISLAGIDIMRVVLTLVIFHGTSLFGLFCPLAGTVVILGRLPDNRGIIAGIVYTVLCIVAYHCFVTLLFRQSPSSTFRYVIESAAVVGGVSALAKLWEARDMRKIANEKKKEQ